MSEAVNHPQHYNTGKIEVIDAIEDWKLGFNDGNAVKYISRHRHKGRAVEDLQKALWYITRELVSMHGVDPFELSRKMMTVKKDGTMEEKLKNWDDACNESPTELEKRIEESEKVLYTSPPRIMSDLHGMQVKASWAPMQNENK